MNRGQTFLLVLLAVVAGAVFLVIVPFLEYVLAAIVFAYVLYPLHVRVSSRLALISPENRIAESLSALLLIVGSLVAIIIPVLYVLTVLIEDLVAITRGDTDLRTELIEAGLAELLAVEVNIEDAIATLGEWLLSILFGDVPGLMLMLLHLSVGVALMLFLVFYLLRDGERFVDWLVEISPLSAAVTETFIDQIDRTMWGAVIGHAFAALVQALIAGIGLYLVGIPNVAFWTMVMVILAFLPLIGVFLVWAPAAGYLYLVGETGMALLLAVYGLTVVSMIDYYVRPIVIDKRARLNPGVILIGVFGGVFTLGFVGLFVGPILIGVLVAILETMRTEFGSPAEPLDEPIEHHQDEFTDVAPGSTSDAGKAGE